MTRILPQRITGEHIIGSINGREYARIVNGIPYRIDN